MQSNTVPSGSTFADRKRHNTCQCAHQLSKLIISPCPKLLETQQKKLSLTTSNPTMLECKLPYRMTRRPPAFVLTFPPIWQLSFAPRSSGTMRSCFSRFSFSFSRMQPDWQTSTPLNEKFKKLLRICTFRWRVTYPMSDVIHDNIYTWDIFQKIITRPFIHIVNLVHERRAYNNFIVDGQSTSSNSGVSSLWHHCKILIGTVLHDFAHFSGISGS